MILGACTQKRKELQRFGTSVDLRTPLSGGATGQNEPSLAKYNDLVFVCNVSVKSLSPRKHTGLLGSVNRTWNLEYDATPIEAARGKIGPETMTIETRARQTGLLNRVALFVKFPSISGRGFASKRNGE